MIFRRINIEIQIKKGKQMEFRNAFKRRLAALLSMVMILSSSVPVHADVIVIDENTSAGAYAEEIAPESIVPEEADQEALVLESTLPGEADQEASVLESTGPEEGIILEKEEPEITVQEVSALKEAEAVPETASGDQVKKADVTIMYYLVGSNLERTGWEATKDMVEMMVGIESAGTAYDPEKINLIAESGGVSFDDDDSSSASTKKAQREEERKALKSKYSDSENKIFDSLVNIDWTKNHRWKLSANSITAAKNDAGTDRSAIMSGKKSTKNSPELTEFIVSTVKAYPAEQYMLVLWDHGGGPKDGFGGDDRAPVNGDYGYITSDQLSNAIKEAKERLAAETLSENGLDKFAMLGFDACLMGNFETSFAMSSYADYLVASEDLEPGTGWDHRGYVRDICKMTSDDFGKDKINTTVEKLGKVICDDSVKFYDPKTPNTMSVVKLDSEKLKNLDEILDRLGASIRHQLIYGAGPLTIYTKLYDAAAKSVCFNGATNGILDLYSFAKNISEKFSGQKEELIKSAADDLVNLLSPVTRNEGNPVIYEKQVETFYGGANSLGGLTVFCPYKDNRYAGLDNEVYDNLRDYLKIYLNNSPIDKDHRLGDGYLNLLGDFCAIQAMGYEVGYWENDGKTDDEVRAKMKAILEGEAGKPGVAVQYSLSSDDLPMLKTLYGGENDLVSMRVSSNDLNVKTVSMNKKIKYVCDVNSEHVPIINRGRQTLILGGTDGKTQYRLGSVPLVSEPVSYVGFSRFVLDNYDTANWFFIEDTNKNTKIPAAILDIRRKDGGEAGIMDVVNDKNDILVYLSMAKRVDYDGGHYLDEAAMEVSFAAGSDTGNILGVYDVDMDRKELNRYVPWVSGNETEFTPVSDMGDMFAGNTSNYNQGYPFNFIYSEEIIGKNLKITRGKTLNGYKQNSKYFEEWSFEFCLKDYFGSDYALTFWEKGESATAEIQLLNDKGETVDYIEKGTPLILNKLFYTSEYYMNFTKDEPRAGYYTEDKVFHEIKAPSDISTLDVGTYEIVYEFSNDDGSIAPADGATVGIEGVTDKRYASSYVFNSSEHPCILTVVDKDGKDLTISGNSSLPYGVYRTLKYSDMSNIVSVKYGGADMSMSPYVSYNLLVNGKSYEYSSGYEDVSFSKTGLKPGDQVTVYAAIRTSDGSIISTAEPAVIEIDRQDVEIIGEAIKDDIYQYALEELYWSRNEIPERKVKIAMYVPWDNAAADRVIENDVFIDGKKHSFNELLSSNDIKKILVNTSSVTDPKTYTKVPLGPDNGKGGAGVFYETDWKSSFNELYKADDPSRIYVEEYAVRAASQVLFYALKEDKELHDAKIVRENAEQLNNRYKVSENAISMKGPEVKTWYIKIGNQGKILIYGNGKSYDMDGNPCVISANKASWRFFIPQDAMSKTVIFYADYDETQSSYEETGKTKFGITIDEINPVEYTGKPIVTTTSGKTGSRIIDLVVKAGDKKLVEGVDYNVSYKNNKNAAGAGDKKAPTLTITGKGEYRGMKAVANFTILPIDMSNTLINVNKAFAPFTSSGKLNVGVTVKLSTDIKVPANSYKLCYYDMEDNELTADKMKELYKGDYAVSVKIKAVALTQTKNPQNYTPGSESNYIYVIGYPKGGKNLSVKLNTSKKPFASDGYKVEDIVKECLNEGSLKVGKTPVNAEDLKEVKAYLDNNLTVLAGEDGTAIYDTGNYYLAFELNDNLQTKYSVYKPTVVKFTITGKNVTKGKTKLTDTKPVLKDAMYDVPVTIEFDKDKCKATVFRIYITGMDGSTYSYTAGYESDGQSYELIIDEDGKLKLPQANMNLGNGAKGSYTITVEAHGEYKGKFNLSYKVM